jgi:serine/threonine protein kinase
MLTGKPPFQSTTADEIYRRARELEYDWPELNKSENYISAETKDLVSLMLQPAEERPDPDTIVQHPFFTCGWMPQSKDILPEFREAAPTSEQFFSTDVRPARTAQNQRSLEKLCVTCCVGPWRSSQKRQQSTYREVAAEEKAGLTPAIPLP